MKKCISGQATSGNQTRAARLLDISRDALRYRIKKFALAEDEDEDAELSASASPPPA